MVFRFFFSLFAISTAFCTEPPRTIPEDLYREFTLDGTISVSSYYFDNSVSPGQSISYSYEKVETLKSKALRREENYYGPTDTYLYRALEHYSSHLKGKRVGIMGSVEPWYEAIVLAFGGHPITIDYNKITSDHPEIHAITIAEYDENPELFDVILSISSFEHDGLGRYGDPINPRGDLDAMKKTCQMLKPNGLLFLAVPVGIDHIYWNAHRIYGKKRLPLLFHGWNVVMTVGYDAANLNQISNGWHQPVFVLSPIKK